MPDRRVGWTGTNAVLEENHGRWRLAAIFGGIAISCVLLTLAGRVVVRLIYAGNAPAFLNSLMTNKEDHPVSHFYSIVDDPVFAVHFLLVVLALLWLTRARRSPWLMFGLLLGADVGLLLLDFRSRSVLLKIWHEWSVPEWFGYFEEVLFALFMYRVFKITGEKVYACLSLTGFMFFLDDAGRYHELMGRVLTPVVEATGLHELLQVDSHYLGEILSLAPYGLLALAGLRFYLRAGPEARKDARIAAFLIGMLFAFGVIIDLMAHLGSVKDLPGFSRDGMAFTEDFGEMIILSALAAFSAAVLWRSERGSRSANGDGTA